MPYLALSDTTDAMMLARVVQMCWKLPRPEVLITVNGSAQDFKLDPRLAAIFERGLADAVTSSNATIISGGMDSGIMKMAASIMIKYAVKLPVLGIGPYKCVNGRDHLRKLAPNGDPNEPVIYGATEAGKANHLGAPINAGHTHFIWVDTAKESKGAPWGCEQTLRASFESAYSKICSCPVLQLLVQGGPGSLKMVLEACKADMAVIVLSESGGAATAIYNDHYGIEVRARADPAGATLSAVVPPMASAGRLQLASASAGSHSAAGRSFSSGRGPSRLAELPRACPRRPPRSHPFALPRRSSTRRGSTTREGPAGRSCRRS